MSACAQSPARGCLLNRINFAMRRPITIAIKVVALCSACALPWAWMRVDVFPQR